MKLVSQKGITIIALIITIIIMLILAGIGIRYGMDAIEEAKIEDIITNMISIKTKAKIVAEQYNFKDIEGLVGEQLDENAEEEGIQVNKYTIPKELKELFESKNEEQIANYNTSNFYVWTQEDLRNKGLNSIKVDTERFYIVYYNLEDTNSCEVYYSKEYKNKFSLTELQSL